MSQNNSVDATDRKIVAELRKNGRASNQQIADALSLTATTVSSRIKRMEEADMLRVVAVSDFAAHGFNFLMRVAVEVEGRPTSDVAKDLAQFPEVFATHIVTGRHDVDLLVALKEFEDLSKLMLDDFAKVKGIRAMIPSVVVDVIKYQFDVAPISERG